MIPHRNAVLHRSRLTLATIGILMAAAMSVLVQVRSTPPIRSSVRPNVLVIVTDDQRARGTLRVMPKTRRLLKQGGRTFSNAFATTPMCCPSRASIFTGRYAHNHGIHVSVPKDPGFDHRSTLQHQLQRASYQTAIFGKYLNGWNLAQDPPFFDSWAIFGNTHRAGYYGGTWNVDGSKQPVDDYSTTFIQERGIEFIREHSSPNQPWALFLRPLPTHHSHPSPASRRPTCLVGDPWKASRPDAREPSRDSLQTDAAPHERPPNGVPDNFGR